MAQKQYSFDFILNAVLNGGFSGTFTKAQQEFIRLGAEIKNLQAIQRDVKAYEKQAAAVQNTTQKLENLKRQYELVGRQITETTGSTTALEREKLKLEQRIANTEGALEKQRQKLGETKDRLDAAGISTDNLAGKDEELRKKVEELTVEQKKAAEGAGDFQNAGVQAIEAVGGAIAAAGIAGAMKGIADAYRECVGVAGDFEQAMSAVEAIASANASEMAALTAEAKELGATTVYTAQQSANAMEFMAMAGWNAQEMLDGMRGMTNLAAAAGEDLAQVSDIVTDNLTAFGLKAADTAHFADVLAAAAANSNTNISIMGETFKNSSSVAGALGYSIEDVAVMVGLMANNAVKGSRAGTALRNIFNGLLGGVTLTGAAFGEMEFSAVNADGSMKGLMETVKELRGSFDQMTEAERVNNAQNIAGMRGYNGLLAILKATDEDFQSLYNSVNNCAGAAERMAKVKLDNLNGDVTILKSAMEALQSTIGEEFTPELRGLAQTGTDVLNGINGFIKENQELTKSILAGAAAFGAMGTAVIGVNAAIKTFKALNLAALVAGPAGALLGIAGVISMVAATAEGAAEADREASETIRELTKDALAAKEAMEETKRTYEDTAEETLAAANMAERYIDRLDELERGGYASEEAAREYNSVLALLLETMPELSDSISATTDEYGRTTYTLNTTTDALRANTKAWKENAMAQALQAEYKDMYAAQADVLLEAEKNKLRLTEATEQQKQAEEELRQALQDVADIVNMTPEDFVKDWGGNSLYEAFGNWKAGGNGIMGEPRKTADAVYNAEAALKDANDAVEAHKKAVEQDAETIAAAEKEMALLEEAVKNAVKAMGYLPYADSAYNANGNTRIYGGFAEGTNNAPPGWSWVGEAGPELMRMHGGEQILPSNVSQEVARTYRAYNKYSGEYAAARAIQSVQSSTRPALEVVAGGQTSSGTKLEMHFHIGEGASPETVDAWREYANSGEFRATVLEVIEDAEADTRRRTLA